MKLKDIALIGKGVQSFEEQQELIEKEIEKIKLILANIKSEKEAILLKYL